MRTAWSRDEVILVVAFMLASQDKKSSAPTVQSLSDFLRALPIHPLEKRAAGFRTTSGLSGQMWYLRDSIKKGERNVHVSDDFLETYQQAAKNPEYYINIATAIKRCQPIYDKIPFGALEEIYSFPEGALLFHTHRYFEQRDGKPANAPQNCQLCGMSAQLSYSADIPLIEPHLMVPPTAMQPAAVYTADQFIYVCPNCHRALHLLRPWRSTIQECQTILYE